MFMFCSIDSVQKIVFTVFALIDALIPKSNTRYGWYFSVGKSTAWTYSFCIKKWLWMRQNWFFEKLCLYLGIIDYGAFPENR